MPINCFRAPPCWPPPANTRKLGRCWRALWSWPTQLRARSCVGQDQSARQQRPSLRVFAGGGQQGGALKQFIGIVLGGQRQGEQEHGSGFQHGDFPLLVVQTAIRIGVARSEERRGGK